MAGGIILQTLGVIGSGVMGSGIGQCAAQNGFKVIINDIADAQLKKSREGIINSLSKRVAKGKMTKECMDGIIDNIDFVDEASTLKKCDVIIEAATENMNLKQKIFAEIENIASEKALLGTNTSGLSVTQIASVLKDPARLVGIHFFNPVPVMRLAEVVRTVIVREEYVDQAKSFAESLGKEVIISKDTPGFIVNYLQYPFRLNAIRMLEKGMATKEEIDLAAKAGLGHPMGPFELQDVVGLDITYNAVSAIYEETKDPLMAPPVLLKRMVEAGFLGKKCGRGFYKYAEEK